MAVLDHVRAATNTYPSDIELGEGLPGFARKEHDRTVWSVPLASFSIVPIVEQMPDGFIRQTDMHRKLWLFQTMRFGEPLADVVPLLANLGLLLLGHFVEHQLRSLTLRVHNFDTEDSRRQH